MGANEPSEKASTEKGFAGFDRLLARIAAVATVIGLCVAIYFGIRTKDHKELEINYLAKLSLISPDASPSEKIRISYDGKVVTNLSKIAIRYSNSGAIPIESKDIENPLTLDFSNSLVLDAKIVEKHPANLQTDISFTNNLVTIKHGLLNPGDLLQIETLCDGDPNFPRALGQQFYQILPSGFDKHARKVVNDLKFDEDVSYQAFVNEAVSKVKEDLFSSTLSKRLLRINKDDVMMAMLFFALALPLSLILAGSWKIILSR